MKPLAYTKFGNSEFYLNIDDLSVNTKIVSLINFDPNWHLYISKVKNYQLTERKSSAVAKYLQQLLYLFKKQIFDDQHCVYSNHANCWVVNKEDIIKNYSKDYYSYNKDGSINLKLIMFYFPEALFVLGGIISIGTLLCLVGFIFYSRRRIKPRIDELDRNNNNNKIIENYEN